MAQEIGNVQRPSSRAWTVENEQKQAGFKADVEIGAGINGDVAVSWRLQGCVAKTSWSRR